MLNDPIIETTSPLLMVSEVFNSFQGEGRNIGLPSTFLRLAYCNLACRWCDSKYTWDWQQYKRPLGEVWGCAEGGAD